MKKGTLVSAILLMAAAAVQAGTIVTFEDPTDFKDARIMFTVVLDNNGDGMITGGWAYDDLVLHDAYANNDYLDVKMGVTGLTVTNYAITGGGTITFMDSTNTTTLFQVDFNTASANFQHISGSSIIPVSSNNVTFSGSIVDAILTDSGASDLIFESFAFGLTIKGISFSNDTTAETTAAFTASAMVPEPTTVVLLGLGSLAIFGRRRRVA